MLENLAGICNLDELTDVDITDDKYLLDFDLDDISVAVSTT